MDMKTRQQAVVLQQIARRNIWTEYRRIDPCLIKVIGHYALYHNTTAIVEYQVPATKRKQSSTKRHLALPSQKHGRQRSGDLEMRQNKSAVLQERQVYFHRRSKSAPETSSKSPPPAYTEIDALQWLLPKDDQNLEPGVEELKVKKSPPIKSQAKQQIQRHHMQQRNRKLLMPTRKSPSSPPQPLNIQHTSNPLRQHPTPPTTSSSRSPPPSPLLSSSPRMKHQNQTWDSPSPVPSKRSAPPNPIVATPIRRHTPSSSTSTSITTASSPSLDKHRRLAISQVVDLLLKALKRLGVPNARQLDGHVDLEAQVVTGRLTEKMGGLGLAVDGAGFGVGEEPLGLDLHRRNSRITA